MSHERRKELIAKRARVWYSLERMASGEVRESYKELLRQLDRQLDDDLDAYRMEEEEKGESSALP